MYIDHKYHYIPQQTGSSLIQVIACCLSGTKPLTEPMLTYCQMDFNEKLTKINIQNSVKKSCQSC